MLAPQTQPQPQPQTSPVGMTPSQPETNPIMPNGQPQNPSPGLVQEDSMEAAGPTEEEIAAHLDGLPDEGKAFLAEHLTQEFVTAIGLISGPEVAKYLMKYADPDKVLVPVPRKVAEENLAAMQAQKQPQAAPQATPSPAPQGGMMAPMQPPATPQ